MRPPKKHKPINSLVHDLHNESLRAYFEREIREEYEAELVAKDEQIGELKAGKKRWKETALDYKQRLETELKRTKIVLVREPGGEWKPKRVLTPSA